MRRYLAPLAALAALTTLACTTDGGRAIADGALDSAAVMAAAPDAALDDATIVAIFDAANTADIETGKLAAERGHSQEVRDFGEMLVRDHTAVRQQGRDLAARLGVTPTPPADDAGARAHAAAMTTLQAKQGADFDKAFLEHEVAFHQNVLDALQGTLLPAIQNADLEAFVVKIAPAFNAHMLAADDIGKQLAQK